MNMHKIIISILFFFVSIEAFAKTHVCWLGRNDLHETIIKEYTQTKKSGNSKLINYLEQIMKEEEYKFSYKLSKCKDGDTLYIYHSFADDNNT